MISRMTSLSRAERNTTRRNSEQNKKFHAMCRDIANQCTCALMREQIKREREIKSELLEACRAW